MTDLRETIREALLTGRRFVEMVEEDMQRDCRKSLKQIDDALAFLAHSIPERGATRCKHHCGCECLTSYENRVEDLEDEIRHLKSLSTPAPEGEWVMVPKEPSKEMLNAARDWSRDFYGKPIGHEDSGGCYRAMIAAAPQDQGGTE